MGWLTAIRAFFGGRSNHRESRGRDGPDSSSNPRAAHSGAPGVGGVPPPQPAKGGTVVVPALAAAVRDRDDAAIHQRRWQVGEVKLNTYKVDDVREGGMGYVYIVEHLGWKMKLAVKVPQPWILGYDQLLLRVEREAQTWTDLGLHPHIAYCHYVRRIGGVPHIFIEYVDGGTLADLLTPRGSDRLDLALDLAIQMCHGIAHAHSRGMVHRDVKPANMLITAGGLLKVTDFGIALAGQWSAETDSASGPGVPTHPRRRVTMLGDGALGTPDYVAPEQYDNPRDVDARADIFSLSVCLYQLLCGRLPYGASSEALPASKIAELAGIEAIEPRALKDTLPGPLSDLVMRCCALKRDQRVATVDEIRRQLEEIYRQQFSKDPPHRLSEILRTRAGELNNRAVSYLDLGQIDDAMASWDRAAQADPRHLETAFNSGFYRWQRGELTDAALVDRLEALAEHHHQDLEYWRALAWIHAERGDEAACGAAAHVDRLGRDDSLAAVLADAARPRFRLCCDALDQPGDYITSAALSPNGRSAVTGSARGRITLLHVETRQASHEFVLRPYELGSHQDRVTALAFLRNGTLLLSASFDDTVAMWDVSRRRQQWRMKSGTYGVSAACAHGGASDFDVLVGGSDGSVRRWDAQAGLPAAEIVPALGAGLLFLDACRHGTRVSAGVQEGANGTVRLWEESARGIWQCRWQRPEPSTSGCLSPDGGGVLVGQAGGDVVWLSAADGHVVRRFLGHRSTVSRICTAGATRVVAAYADGTIRIWDTESGRSLRSAAAHQSAILGVGSSTAGMRLVTGGHDRRVRVWDLAIGPLPRNARHPYPMVSRIREVREIAASDAAVQQGIARAETAVREGRFLEAHDGLRRLQEWRGYERDGRILDLICRCGLEGKGRRRALRDAWPAKELGSIGTEVRYAALAPGGATALLVPPDKTIRLWDLCTGKEIGCCTGHALRVIGAAFSEDGSRLLSGSQDRIVRVWDVQSGTPVTRWCAEATTKTMTALAFSADGRHAMSGDSEGTVRLWSMASTPDVWAEGIRITGAHRSPACAASLDARGVLAVSAGEDGTLRVWTTVDGVERAHMLHGRRLSSRGALSMSPDGSTVISAGADAGFVIWALPAGERVATLGEDLTPVRSTSFSPDSRFALTSHAPNGLVLWDITTRTRVRDLAEAGHDMSCGVFLPSGTSALSCGSDGRLVLWQFDWEWAFDAEPNERRETV